MLADPTGTAVVAAAGSPLSPCWAWPPRRLCSFPESDAGSRPLDIQAVESTGTAAVAAAAAAVALVVVVVLA